jgi:hypothetical protein
LTPIQRIAVIAICLALTALIVMLLAPWVWTQIIERLTATATPAPGALLVPPLSSLTIFAQSDAVSLTRLA